MVADRRGWANTILVPIGDDYPDDLKMMTLESLARLALAVCDSPQDAEAIRLFERPVTS